MSVQLGTNDRPLRVAIIGSGPSGFYAAESIFKTEIVADVDMFDQLPAPFGLVRYGVAPDHAKIKSVTKVYEKTASHERFHFLGNVHVGKDITVDELRRYYDVLIFCCGAQTDRKLHISGIDLSGSHTATEFVAWYNGHPHYRNLQFDLSQEVAVIVGQGNVAMDVARILCKTVDELKATDISKHALDALAQSKVKEVHMFGRRGPMQAACTPPELKEFGELEDCEPVVDTLDTILNADSHIEYNDPDNAQQKKNYDIIRHFSLTVYPNKHRKFQMHFLKSPVEIQGNGRVEKVIFELNELFGEPNAQKSKPTGERQEFKCGLFFRSVGYRGVPMPGLPFDEQRGVIINEQGRVSDFEHLFTGIYVSGWIKRGPSGVIGTNKPDSEETVQHMLQDLAKGYLIPCSTPHTKSVLNLLDDRGIRVVSYDDWKKIDAVEITAGQAVGKPREKFTSVEEMLKVIE